MLLLFLELAIKYTLFLHNFKLFFLTSIILNFLIIHKGKKNSSQ